MHLFGGPEDGVYRTGLNTFCTADAVLFNNERHRGFSFGAVLCIQWSGFHVQQVSKGLNTSLTARRAFVDAFTRDNSFCIRAATGIPALSALCLGQDCIDLIGNGVAFGAEANRRKAKDRPKHEAKAQHCQ